MVFANKMFTISNTPNHLFFCKNCCFYITSLYIVNQFILFYNTFTIHFYYIFLNKNEWKVLSNSNTLSVTTSMDGCCKLQPVIYRACMSRCLPLFCDFILHSYHTGQRWSDELSQKNVDSKWCTLQDILIYIFVLSVRLAVSSHFLV